MDIRIGGRTVPMLLTVCEMADVQEAVGCTIGQLRDEVFGLVQDPETGEYTFHMIEDKDKIRKFASLIRVLGNAGLDEAGQEPDLTDKWVMRHIRPMELMDYVGDVTRVINEAMQTEAAEAEDGPVDEVVEEQNRKKERES